MKILTNHFPHFIKAKKPYQKLPKKIPKKSTNLSPKESWSPFKTALFAALVMVAGYLSVQASAIIMDFISGGLR